MIHENDSFQTELFIYSIMMTTLIPICIFFHETAEKESIELGYLVADKLIETGEMHNKLAFYKQNDRHHDILNPDSPKFKRVKSGINPIRYVIRHVKSALFSLFGDQKYSSRNHVWFKRLFIVLTGCVMGYYFIGSSTTSSTTKKKSYPLVSKILKELTSRRVPVWELPPVRSTDQANALDAFYRKRRGLSMQEPSKDPYLELKYEPKAKVSKYPESIEENSEREKQVENVYNQFRAMMDAKKEVAVKAKDDAEWKAKEEAERKEDEIAKEEQQKVEEDKKDLQSSEEKKVQEPEQQKIENVEPAKVIDGAEVKEESNEHVDQVKSEESNQGKVEPGKDEHHEEAH